MNRNKIHLNNTSEVSRAAFSPKENCLFTAHKNGMITALTFQSDIIPFQASTQAHKDEITFMEFSPDGRLLFTCCDKHKEFCLWEVEREKDTIEFFEIEQTRKSFPSDLSLAGITFLEGDILFIFENWYAVRFVYLTDCKSINDPIPTPSEMRYTFHTPTDIAVHPNGQSLLLAQEGIFLYNLETTDKIEIIKTEAARHPCFIPNSTLFAYTISMPPKENYNPLILFDLKTNKEICSVLDVGSPIKKIVPSNSGEFILAITDYRIQIWKVSSLISLENTKLFKEGVGALVDFIFSEDGASMTAVDFYQIYKFDLYSNESAKIYNYLDKIKSFSCSESGAEIGIDPVSMSPWKSVRDLYKKALYRPPETLTQRFSNTSHKEDFHRLRLKYASHFTTEFPDLFTNNSNLDYFFTCVSSDSEHILCANHTKFCWSDIHLISIKGNEEIFTIPQECGAFALSGNGSFFTTAKKNLIEIWDVSLKKILLEINFFESDTANPNSLVLSYTLSPKGYVALIDEEHLFIWKISKKDENYFSQQIFISSFNYINFENFEMKFIKNDSLLVVRNGNEIYICDIFSKNTKKLFMENIKLGDRYDISSDGSLLAIGDTQKHSLFIHDLLSGKKLETELNFKPSGVRISPDDRLLACWSFHNNKINIWEILKENEEVTLKLIWKNPRRLEAKNINFKAAQKINEINALILKELGGFA